MKTHFSMWVKIIERGTLHPLYQYTLISVCQPSLLGFKIQYLNHSHNKRINAAIYSRAHDLDFQWDSHAPEVPHVSSTL
jgi:hypothetical protein